MEHSFRLSGDIYVAKTGDDTSSLDPSANPQCVNYSNTATFKPLRTLQKAFELAETNQVIIVGSGVYADSIVTNITGLTIKLQADGEVVIPGSPQIELNFTGGNLTFTGITIKNFSGNFSVGNFYLYNCVLINMNFSGTVAGYLDLHEGCQLINCIITGGRRLLVRDGIIVGSDLKNVKILEGCYVDSTSKLLLYSGWDGGVMGDKFRFNNIQGLIATAPSGSDVNDALYLSFADHRVQFPEYNIYSFTLDPKFNRAEVGDFSLQFDSPHIGAGLGKSNIGGTNVAKSAFVGTTESHLEQLSYWSNPNIVEQGNSYVIQSGSTSGEVVLSPIQIAQYPAPVQKLNYFGLLAFDANAGDGSADKKNVPDSVSGSYSVKASTPDRLSVQIRWSTGFNEPLAAQSFDNQGALPAGEWVDVEINQKPLVDSAGNGNGHPDFSPVFSQGVVATWIQVRVVLRNDYTTVS